MNGTSPSLTGERQRKAKEDREAVKNAKALVVKASHRVLQVIEAHKALAPDARYIEVDRVVLAALAKAVLEFAKEAEPQEGDSAIRECESCGAIAYDHFLCDECEAAAQEGVR